MYKADASRYDLMQYNRVGKSGLKFPAVSLGFWHNFGSKDNYDNMKQMCRTAFDLGITQFDLANNYGPVYGSAESNFGRLMEEDFRSYRDELVITTKAGYDMWDGPYGNWGSRKYLMASLDQSLKRMKLDYVDIFYHHRMDPDTPLEETMQALADIVRSGKALYAGVSNYNKEYTEKAVSILKELHCPFIVNQRRYSMFDRTIEEDGVKKYCKEAGVGIIAFSPLAQGMLTDKYLEGIPQDSRIARDNRFLHKSDLTEERLRQIAELNELAKQRGQTLAQMALSWVLKDDEVCSVLIGASKPSQIKENISIVEQTSFSEEELKMIEKICER
ncbi:L-glyceraldehyde 3-phosphate reductase [Firmicutes bacterium AM43-11BH]|nr:L-glyceraldehyde 3-phosphate reductase [Firmicutes bacterium AM43-11BH]